MIAYIVPRNDDPERFAVVEATRPPEGVVCLAPEGATADDGEVLRVHRAYIHPETQTEIELGDEEQPPQITYTPPGGEERTVTPSVIRLAAFDPALVAQRDADRAAAAAESEAHEAENEYREKRKLAYTVQLGKSPRPNPLDTIGDVLDNVVRVVHKIKTDLGIVDAPWDDMVGQIATIKAQYPPPEES